MNKEKQHIKPQLLKRAILLFAIVLFCFNWINGILPHQLANAPLFDISLDNTFWLFHLTGIPQWIIHQPILLILLEISLLLLAILAFVKNKVVFNVSFLLLFTFLMFLTQTYSATLTKTSVVFPIVFLPFCLKESWLPSTLKIPRYYLVYLMTSAGLFKLINGGLFHIGQMENILLNQHADLLFYESQHISTKIKLIFVTKPWVSQLTYSFTALLEFSFIFLLFTKKLDRFFACLIVLFCIGTYMTFRIYTLDILALALPLLSFYRRN